MGNLDELIEFLTIRFPRPLDADAVEGELFDHLRTTTFCDINYVLSIQGHKRSTPVENERYAREMRVQFLGFADGEVAFPNARLLKDKDDFFNGMQFETNPGYDSLDEYAQLGNGKASMILIQRIRQAIESYFTGRNQLP